MNWGQNLFDWFITDAQYVVLLAIAIIGVYIGVKRKLTEAIGFFIIAIIAVVAVFNTAGLRDVLLDTKIWTVDKMLYVISDMTLPVPVKFRVIKWFVGMFVLMIFLKDIPPFDLIDNFLFTNIAVPVLAAWLMNQKVFDGKEPFSFLKSVFRYLLRAKITFGEKPAKLRSAKGAGEITVVKGELVNG